VDPVYSGEVLLMAVVTLLVTVVVLVVAVVAPVLIGCRCDSLSPLCRLPWEGGGERRLRGCRAIPLGDGRSKNTVSTFSFLYKAHKKRSRGGRQHIASNDYAIALSQPLLLRLSTPVHR